MELIYLTNFFTDNELLELKSYLKNFTEKKDSTSSPQNEVMKDIPTERAYEAPSIITEYMGRINTYFKLQDIPNIFDKIVSTVKKYHPDYEYFYSTYSRYSPIYGTPSLGPHFDSNLESIITFDMKIGGNTDWPISVENIYLPMEENSVIIFKPAEVVHWRPRKKFYKNEYIDNIFIDFVNKEIKLNTSEDERRKISDEWSNYY